MTGQTRSPGDAANQGKRDPAIFYKTEAGGEPVREWLKGLSPEDRKRIGVDIKTVELGWPIGMPVCRPVGGAIYEVRTNLSQKPHRSRAVLLGSQESDGVTARIHQKDSKNCTRGSPHRPTEQE